MRREKRLCEVGLASRSRGPWTGLLCLSPSIGVGLLPKCPLCFIALASFLDAVGIDASTYSRGLLPVLVVLLTLPIVLLGCFRVGWARVRTVILMSAGATLYLAARVSGWPMAIQAVCGGIYCLGALWKSQERSCCILNTLEPSQCHQTRWRTASSLSGGLVREQSR
jgi:hypothetical protein